MAVAIRPDRNHSKNDPVETPPLPPNPSARHDPEAPDHGGDLIEAPERRDRRHAEAPDAGDGRAGLIESEYTHGRSHG